MMQIRRQNGVSLFAAVFLITVIAAVGVAVTAITATRNVSSAQSLEATRAWFAARERLELAIAEVLTTSGGCTGLGSPQIHGFSTEISCTSSSFNEGGPTDYQVFNLEVAAYRGSRAAGTLVRRDVEAVVTNAP